MSWDGTVNISASHTQTQLYAHMKGWQNWLPSSPAEAGSLKDG